MSESGTQQPANTDVDQQLNNMALPSLQKALESALVLALLSASAYLVGYSYFDSFFTRLSFPRYSVTLATVEYMYQALIMLVVVGVASIPAVMVASKTVDKVFRAFCGNLPLIVLILVIGIWTYRQRDWLAMGQFSFSLIAVVIATIMKKSLAHYLYKSNNLIRTSILAGVVFFACYVALLLGDIHAEKLINGTLYRSVRVALVLKKEMPELTNKELMLIMMDERNYYLVERSDPAPQFPQLFIIARDEVLVARIDRVK